MIRSLADHKYTQLRLCDKAILNVFRQKAEISSKYVKKLTISDSYTGLKLKKPNDLSRAIWLFNGMGRLRPKSADAISSIR